jgi:2-keto-4-pentenoate hydratase/2-oxohepta-3-ene-1,7-dioic acid hydratase in catechol pathway
MRIIRYKSTGGQIGWAVLQANGSARKLNGDPSGGHAESGEPIDSYKTLAPVVPTNIIGIGMNYRKHAEEGGKEPPEYPMWFMKTTGSLQNPGDPIVIPGRQSTEEVDYEAELAVVIARSCRNATKENAFEFVLGYTCANDVSARDWQYKRSGGQFCQAKSFDTFCPLGPVLVTRAEIPDPNDLKIRSVLNGQVMQDWTTKDMLFDVPTLIEFLSSDRTLPAGTVILTGTPHGVGFARKPPVWLHPGDTITIEIEQIGALTNPVTANT